MTSVDWEEVKRLAADFQKAQLSNLQRLSERNCIEIITKLIESKMLNVIFTIDGKEFVTPEHLEKEIKDEIYVHGGRISLVELTKILNLDLSHITKAAADIEKRNRDVKLVLGQLIDRMYMSKIAEEINEKLNQQGHINIADLTIHYDLPPEFLQSLIEKELGKTIFGKQDSQDAKVFYNQDYVARNEAKVRGALAAITKPTPISAILGQCSVPERIFFSISENLQRKHQIPGTITGKQGANSIYVPTIYSKSQNEYVNNFYKHNGYLEYDALTRLGIGDARSFVKRHFPNEKLVLLDTVAVGQSIIDQVDANIEEAVSAGIFLDIYPLMPSVFSPEDVEKILKESTLKLKAPVHILSQTYIMAESFLQSLHKKLEPLAEKKAKEAVDSGKWLQNIVENKLKSKGSEVMESKNDRKAERRKKASSGKAGGGSQGRETRTKSTKKKYLAGKSHEFDSDEEPMNHPPNKLDFELVSEEDVKKELRKDSNFADSNELIDQLAPQLQASLNKHVAIVAEQLLQKYKNTSLNEIDDRLNILATNIRVFDKGIKHLDKEVQITMVKYLLKTLGVDVATELFKIAAHQNVLQCPNNLTTEARSKMLFDLPIEVKEPLSNLHSSLMGNSVDDFLNFIEPAMAACCLVLKKYDKKKERPVVVGHREALLEQLSSTQDPALALHLATNVLFIAATQSALHMSGRHVSSILTFLQPYLEPETNAVLAKYHDLVLKFLSSNDEGKEETRGLLEDGLPEIRSIANTYKKHLKSEKVQDS